MSYLHVDVACKFTRYNRGMVNQLWYALPIKVGTSNLTHASAVCFSKNNFQHEGSLRRILNVIGLNVDTLKLCTLARISA